MAHKPRILLWDTETADLRADFGHILCIAYKWFGESRAKVISISDGENWPQAGKTLWDDSAVVEDFMEVYETADISVTWYGKRFDVPYLRSRALYWRLPNNMPPIHQIDLWETCRSELCISSNRLANFGTFAQLEEGKMHMPVSDWKRAAQGSGTHMKKTVKRCKSDVHLLEEAYTRLRPYIRNHPNYNVIRQTDHKCPSCGSEHLSQQGYRTTRTARQRRFQCQECGAWSQSPMKRGVVR